MIVTAQGPLDTSGLTVAPAGTIPPAVTQAALDALPASGLAPFNLIDYADTSVSTSINWWLVGAAVGVFVLALSIGGRR